MTTATGDIALDVSGVANTNPYTLPAELTGYGDNKRVFNGKIRIWDAGGFYTTDAPSSDTITAVIEIGSDNGDNFGPAVVNTSQNGWYLTCRYDQVNIMPIAAGVGSVSYGSDPILTVSQALATGDLVTLEYTNSTGVFRVLHNGSEIGTTTDATYDDLRAGYHCVTSDYADTGAISWAATGYAAASTPTISNVDGDNAVNQYQLVNINVTDFTETITSVTINSVAVDSIPDNDPTDDVIQVRMPGTLATGSYDVVVSGSTETDTISGVSYTQTHARPAFDGLVDSNSILSGQSYTANTYFRFVTSFSNGTLDTAAGDADEWANDIADYYTPDSEFTGDDTASIEFLYSDGTTSSTVDVTITVEGADETAPTVTSASVPTSGDNIAVQMDESMQVGSGGSGGWTISLTGVSVTSAAVDGTDDTIINLTPSRTLTDEDTLTIGYTQPGNGFQDQADTPNDLATLSGQAVTNNSTQTPPDVTGPVTTSVTGPSDGSYKADDVLPFTVAWDEVVFVSGAPAINFDMGGDNRKASYASGSESDEAVFSYTVQPGDNAASGISVTSLTLDGGTIKDASDNDADLTLNSVADLSGVLVDTVKPVITPVGGTTSTVVVGNSYTDAGATAFDDQGGSLGTVTGTGSVDTDTIGEYTITYPGAGVVDTAGNEADDATRTVNVVAVQLGVIGRVKQSRSRSNRRYPARV